MPKGRFAEIVILAEDRTHVRFIRSWLAEKVSHRVIRDRIPERGGAGEQFVRNAFPGEAEAHRLHSARRSSMLIAVVDADTGDADRHYEELMRSATVTHGIFIFVPKRSIETWLHQLAGQAANEQDSYKAVYRKRLGEVIPLAGQRFLELVREQQVEGLLPSLAKGIQEAGRIPRFHDQQ